MKKLYNGLGQLAGFLTVLLFAFLNLHALVDFEFLTADIYDLLVIIKTYAIYVVIGLAGLEFAAGKKLIALIYFLLLAFVVISTFFPDVYNQLTNGLM